jgi:hypothetical protein
MRIVVCVFFVFLMAVSLSARENTGDDLTIKIAIFGPGDEIYSWFGHNVLIIEDAYTGQSQFYNYGLFSYESEDFILNFVLGRMLYSAFSTENDIADYIKQNRDVVLYTLDLPPEKREEVREFAEISVLPENRDYIYHLFKDNCSTRIRDIIDIAVDGQFKKQLDNTPGRFTFRQHARRHIWFSPFWDWTLNFLMGRDIDQPITVWDEMYLPLEVANQIMNFSYKDMHGISHKLVLNVETIYLSHNRPAVLDAPSRQWPAVLIFSLIFSSFIGFLFFLQSKKPVVGRIMLGICHSILGLCIGCAGVLLFFVSFFTDHDYTFHNANLLFCNPILLAAIPLGIQYASSDNYNKRLFAETSLRIIWFLIVIGVFISIFFRQENLAVEVLILPIAITFSLEPIGLKKLLTRIFGQCRGNHKMT